MEPREKLLEKLLALQADYAQLRKDYDELAIGAENEINRLRHHVRSLLDKLNQVQIRLDRDRSQQGQQLFSWQAGPPPDRGS